uniref:Uncharacterized protein n=1 Tax=Arion vulgaris TaxID=1028688 RepID=A0A0B7AAD1_9EUPU
MLVWTQETNVSTQTISLHTETTRVLIHINRPYLNSLRRKQLSEQKPAFHTSITAYDSH